MTTTTLLTWHSTNHGVEVLESAIGLLKTKRITVARVLYLVQARAKLKMPPTVCSAEVQCVELDLDDPTDHSAIYTALQTQVLPLLGEGDKLHVNISPGTPAMHAAWLVLYAGGAFPSGTKLWSTQYDPHRKQRRISRVQFEINTYLAEVRRGRALRPKLGQYDPEARSAARRDALERLCRYSRVAGAPLLIIGERGIGKTRLVETHVADVKGREVLSIACGGLDPALAASALFGHVKGAFTGADSKREGAVVLAKGKVLFLDEVQDLPKLVQRKLVRVLQDRTRRYTPVGSDNEETSEFEVVCASNRSLKELQQLLDPDLFDRLAHLVVTIPPLRECREDLLADWQAVWRELRAEANIEAEAPSDAALLKAIEHNALPGNFRDLQRLALLCMAWGVHTGCTKSVVSTVLREWQESRMDEDLCAETRYFTGSREERGRAFHRELALWAKTQYGTWRRAAAALKCNEKTLRSDSASGEVL